MQGNGQEACNIRQALGHHTLCFIRSDLTMIEIASL